MGGCGSRRNETNASDIRCTLSFLKSSLNIDLMQVWIVSKPYPTHYNLAMLHKDRPYDLSRMILQDPNNSNNAFGRRMLDRQGSILRGMEIDYHCFNSSGKLSRNIAGAVKKLLLKESRLQDAGLKVFRSYTAMAS